MADQSYDEFNNSSFTHAEKCVAGMMHGLRDGTEEERREKMFEANIFQNNQLKTRKIFLPQRGIEPRTFQS